MEGELALVATAAMVGLAMTEAAMAGAVREEEKRAGVAREAAATA